VRFIVLDDTGRCNFTRIVQRPTPRSQQLVHVSWRCLTQILCKVQYPTNVFKMSLILNSTNIIECHCVRVPPYMILNKLFQNTGTKDFVEEAGNNSSFNTLPSAGQSHPESYLLYLHQARIQTMCAIYLTQLAGIDSMYVLPTSQSCSLFPSSSSPSSSSSLSCDSHETFEPSQLFHDWCYINEYIPSAFITTYLFLRELKLCVFPDDPLDYPGLSHAVSLLTSDHHRFEHLSRRDQDKITFSLDRVYSDQYINNFFDINQTVGHRWRISSTLSDAGGFFNRGVHMVQDMEHSPKSPSCVLKVLPSESTYPSYAEREIAILYTLRDHPNIVQLKDSFVPSQRHVAPAHLKRV
jgi:hypothetical protein